MTDIFFKSVLADSYRARYKEYGACFLKQFWEGKRPIHSDISIFLQVLFRHGDQYLKHKLLRTHIEEIVERNLQLWIGRASFVGDLEMVKEILGKLTNIRGCLKRGLINAILGKKRAVVEYLANVCQTDTRHASLYAEVCTQLCGGLSFEVAETLFSGVIGPAPISVNTALLEVVKHHFADMKVVSYLVSLGATNITQCCAVSLGLQHVQLAEYLAPYADMNELLSKSCFDYLQGFSPNLSQQIIEFAISHGATSCGNCNGVYHSTLNNGL